MIDSSLFRAETSSSNLLKVLKVLTVLTVLKVGTEGTEDNEGTDEKLLIIPFNILSIGQ